MCIYKTYFPQNAWDEVNSHIGNLRTWPVVTCMFIQKHPPSNCPSSVGGCHFVKNQPLSLQNDFFLQNGRAQSLQNGGAQPLLPRPNFAHLFPGTKGTEPFCAELLVVQGCASPFCRDLVGPFVEGRGCALPFCRDLVDPFCSRHGLCLAILVKIAKPYPTPIAWRGCDLDFLVKNQNLGVGSPSTKSETYPQKNLKTSLQNPLSNPLVLVHQCQHSLKFISTKVKCQPQLPTNEFVKPKNFTCE